jgi:hypothetical protein
MEAERRAQSGEDESTSENEGGGGSSEDIYAMDGAKGGGTPSGSRVCAPAPRNPSPALAFVPCEPSHLEMSFIFVPRQPDSARPFAHVKPGPTLDARNQTCIPQARLGHMHLTKHTLSVPGRITSSHNVELNVKSTRERRVL